MKFGDSLLWLYVKALHFLLYIFKVELTEKRRNNEYHLFVLFRRKDLYSHNEVTVPSWTGRKSGNYISMLIEAAMGNAAITNLAASKCDQELKNRRTSPFHKDTEFLTKCCHHSATLAACYLPLPVPPLFSLKMDVHWLSVNTLYVSHCTSCTFRSKKPEKTIIMGAYTLKQWGKLSVQLVGMVVQFVYFK